MLGKTIFVQSGKALTSAFRSATFLGAQEYSGAPSGTTALTSTDSTENAYSTNDSLPTQPKELPNSSADQPEITIQVIAPFTSSNITADIFLRVKSLFPCHFSIYFDPTELKYDKATHSWPWDSSDCLLILGHEQPVMPKVFEGIQNYLKNGGRVVYWGNIASDEGTQFELIGAKRKSVLSKSCVTVSSDSSKLIEGIREFCPIGKVPRFTYLSPDCQSFLSVKGASSPVAWTRNVGNGKLFYCGLSDESDWLGDDCITLMLNAVRWAFDKNQG